MPDQEALRIRAALQSIGIGVREHEAAQHEEEVDTETSIANGRQIEDVCGEADVNENLRRWHTGLASSPMR